MKLLLTWFRDAERIPPEKLRLAESTGPGSCGLDWLEAERGCSAATRNQRLAVIKSFCRYTAVEQPGHLDQVPRSSRSGRENPAGQSAVATNVHRFGHAASVSDGPSVAGVRWMRARSRRWAARTSGWRA